MDGVILPVEFCECGISRWLSGIEEFGENSITGGPLRVIDVVATIRTATRGECSLTHGCHPFD